MRVRDQKSKSDLDLLYSHIIILSYMREDNLICRFFFVFFFQILREADCKHRALAHNNVGSRKLRIWLKFWEIDLYHACLRFTSFKRPTLGRFHGNEESILKISILSRACNIPSLKFEQRILSPCFLYVWGGYT